MSQFCLAVADKRDNYSLSSLQKFWNKLLYYFKSVCVDICESILTLCRDVNVVKTVISQRILASQLSINKNAYFVIIESFYRWKLLLFTAPTGHFRP